MRRIGRTILLLLLPVALHGQTPAAEIKDLPEAPRPHVHEAVFWAGTALLAGSESADAVSTQQLLARGGEEGNSLFGRNPSVGREAGICALIFGGQVTLFHYTERNRRWYVRWAGRSYLGLVIANHIWLASCNSRMDPHSGHAPPCSYLPV